jgi:penicillin-binding protein 2
MRDQVKNYYAETRVFVDRSIAAGIIALLLLLVVSGRLFYLQVLKHDYYSTLSQGNRIRIEPVPPRRGLILDRNGVVLADNQPAFNLELVREQVGDMKSVDATLAKLVDIGVVRAEDMPAVRRGILSHKVYESVPVKLQLGEEEMARFAVHRYEIPGVDIRASLARHYPFKDHGVHAIGYVAAISEDDQKRIDSVEYAGTTLIGKLGVEGAYEAQLHGKPGFREVLVNAAGKPVEKQGEYVPVLNSRPPVAGKDLILGIDMRVQQVAEAALTGKRGSVVALDPKTGDVIVMASTPGFDPNTFVRGLSVAEYRALATDIDVPLLNRALRGAYPPGSTVKPLYALAAQKYGVLTPEQTQFCGGFFQLPGSSNKYRDDKKHGNLDMREAIAQSCDVYFFRLAHMMGIGRMDEFMQAFGYGQLTGIDIAGEKPGLYASPEWKKQQFKRAADQVWFPGETISMGIGQGPITVTPLQQAHFASELAERGQIVAVPHLVSAIRAPDTDATTRIASRFLKPVDTAYPSLVKPLRYKFAGKTGTAQVFTVKQTESTKTKATDERKRDHAWFIAFAPIEDPKIAIAVLVENGGFGGSTSAPIAQKVLDAFLLGDQAGTPPVAPPARPVGTAAPPTTALR